MRNNRKNNKKSTEKILSVVVAGALVCALAVGVISVTNSTRKGAANIVDLNETKAEQVKLQDNNNIGSTAAPQNNYALNQATETPTLVEPLVKPTEAQTEPELPTKANPQNVAADSEGSVLAKYSFSENDTLKWPVNGDVVMKFSMDSTIYFETLGLYKVNPAVNIASEVGTNVIAAASGVVSSVTTSEETGTTVSISIGNDYVTTYGLLDDVNLKKGMTVVAGDVIGKVAEPSKYYTKEGSSLYFKLTKADTPVDPMIYLE